MVISCYLIPFSAGRTTLRSSQTIILLSSRLYTIVVFIVRISRPPLSHGLSDTQKNGCEPEALPDSIYVPAPKRFHDEETDRFVHLLQLDKTVADEEEDEYAPIEQLVSRIMRNLEEEIAATCSSFILPSIFADNAAAASDIYRDHEGQTLDSDAWFDLSYLMNALDDELDIPPSLALDLKDEVCLSQKETYVALSENSDLKSLSEN